MADLAMDSRPVTVPARNLAIAVSVVAHVLVLLALFWKFGSAPTYAELPAMNVQLAPRPKTRPPPRPPTKATTRPPAHVSPRLEAAPPGLSRPVLEPPAPETAPPAPAVRDVLRKAIGCDPAMLARLSAAEREACLDRLAKAPAGGAMALNLDRRGYAAGKAQEPYLQRKPRNGCKIGAGGDTTPSGVQGVAGGVGCALSF